MEEFFIALVFGVDMLIQVSQDSVKGFLYLLIAMFVYKGNDDFFYQICLQDSRVENIHLLEAFSNNIFHIIIKY